MSEKGFSIGEVLISVFVLGISLTVLVVAVAKNIKSSMDSRDLVVASELAQEGVEIARNLRDLNWAAASPDSLPSFSAPRFPANDSNDCRLDMNSAAFSCGGSYDLSLVGNYYVHGGGAGKFRRQIRIDYIGGGGTAADAETAAVTSLVFWGSDIPAQISDCTLGNKCTYTDLTLTRWGEF